jgi:5-hydroxyisourate hydrolase
MDRSGDTEMNTPHSPDTLGDALSSLSTHVLDTAHGCPAANVAVRLLSADGEVIASAETDKDGRCPTLPALAVGRYRLEFAVAAYFRARVTPLSDPPFLDVVAIDFGIAERGGHYPVPLLVAPYGYSTYRGS